MSKNLFERYSSDITHQKLLKTSKKDKEAENNPFLLLGSGVNTYLNLTMRLLCMMLFITAILLPAMIWLRSFDVSMDDTRIEIMQFSLGSLGGATPICKQEKFIERIGETLRQWPERIEPSMQLQCAPDLIIDLDANVKIEEILLFDAGIIPVDSDITTYCTSGED